MAIRKRVFTYRAYKDAGCYASTKLDSTLLGSAGKPSGWVYCVEYEGLNFPFSFDRLPLRSVSYDPVLKRMVSMKRSISDTTWELMILHILEYGLAWLYREFEYNMDYCCTWTVGTDYDEWIAKTGLKRNHPNVVATADRENLKGNHRINRLLNRVELQKKIGAAKSTLYSTPEPSVEPTYTTTTAQTSAKGEPTMSEVTNEKTLMALKDLKNSIDALKRPTLLEESLIEAVVSKTKDIATQELEKELQAKLDVFIEKKYGILPKQLQVVINKDHTLTLTGLFHDKFNDILTMIANNIPVMVTGPAGSGKNFTLEQVAEALDIPFFYTGAITQEYKLTGFIDAGGHFHQTEFYKAFKDGGLFMLDEVDASSPETLVILNGAIANRYFDFPTGRIKAHDNFRIACAGNTYGTGADMIYVGRNVLDGATLDRFCVIKMDYDTEVEKKLCPDTELFGFVQVLRKTVNKMKLRHIVGMRASINGYKALEAGMSKAFIIESIILKGLSVDDVVTIRKNLQGSMSAAWKRELDEYSSRLESAR